MQELEDRALGLGRDVEGRIVRSLDGLLAEDAAAVTQIVSADDHVDRLARALEGDTHDLILLQAPMADDLRLLLAILRLVRNIERIGDHTVNLARLTGGTHAAAADTSLSAQIHELGVLCQRAMRTGLDCFGLRAADGVSQVEAVQQQIDLLRHGLHDRLAGHAVVGPRQATWALRMTRAVSNLERMGDRSVTIAELGAFIPGGARRPIPADRD